MNQPLELTKIAPEDIRWRNQLVGQCRDISMQIAGQPAKLNWLDCVPAVNGKLVQVSAGDLSWLVGLSDWDQLPCVKAALGIDVLSSLPELILLAVLEMTFEEQLDQISNRLTTRCELAGLEQSYPDDDDIHRIGFEVVMGAGSFSGAVAGDSAAMALLCDWALATKPKSETDVNALPIVAPIEIGMTQLSLAELQQISPGDVVVMDISTFGENGRGLVRFPPYLVWRIHVDDDKIIFEESFQSEPPKPVADNVMLAVVAQLGRLTLTVGQMAELAPEASLPYLSNDVVTLSLEGQPFASGELVKIGPKIGVRVNSISLDTPAQSFPLTMSTSAQENPLIVDGDGDQSATQV